MQVISLSELVLVWVFSKRLTTHLFTKDNRIRISDKQRKLGSEYRNEPWCPSTSSPDWIISTKGRSSEVAWGWPSSIFGLVGQHQCFELNEFSYRKPVKRTQQRGSVPSSKKDLFKGVQWSIWIHCYPVLLLYYWLTGAFWSMLWVIGSLLHF